MMDLRAREQEGVVIVDVVGRMDEATTSLQTAVDEALAKGQTGVVLNLQEVTYVNSIWLGVIVQQFMKLSRAGGKLKLLNPRPNLMQLLVMTQLSTLFDVFTSEEDAVNSFLVLLSSSSVGKTGYLQREIEHALDAAEEQSDDSIFIIPSRLEPCDVPERLRRWQWVDLFAADGYDRLLTALQARALALGRTQIRPGVAGRS